MNSRSERDHRREHLLRYGQDYVDMAEKAYEAQFEICRLASVKEGACRLGAPWVRSRSQGRFRSVDLVAVEGVERVLRERCSVFSRSSTCNKVQLLGMEELLRCRHKSVASPRAVAMYISHHHTKDSSPTWRPASRS